MKRWLFNLVAAVSLLLSLTAAAAWAMSYARPLDWHLLGIAHSADLTRVNLDRRTVVFMMPVNGSHVPRYGYWDALWTRSQSGRLSLVAQATDYDGNLRAVYASPPWLMKSPWTSANRVVRQASLSWRTGVSGGAGKKMLDAVTPLHRAEIRRHQAVR